MMTQEQLVELLASMAEVGLLAAFDSGHEDGPDYYITNGGLAVTGILIELLMASHTGATRNEVSS
jgi:hypothetical protein